MTEQPAQPAPEAPAAPGAPAPGPDPQPGPAAPVLPPPPDPAPEPDHKALLSELAEHIRNVAASPRKDVYEILSWLAGKGL